MEKLKRSAFSEESIFTVFCPVCKNITDTMDNIEEETEFICEWCHTVFEMED